MNTLDFVTKLVFSGSGCNNDIRSTRNAIDLLRHMMHGCMYYFGNKLLAFHISNNTYIVYVNVFDTEAMFEFEYKGNYVLYLKNGLVCGYANLDNIIEYILPKLSHIIMVLGFMSKKMSIADMGTIAFANPNKNMVFMRNVLKMYNGKDDTDYFKSIVPKPNDIFKVNNAIFGMNMLRV